MTKVQRLKAELDRLIGEHCKDCGSIMKPSVDHIYGRSYSLAHLSESKRLEIYVKEAKQGLLQRLCVPCNSRKNRVQVNKGFRSQFVCKCERCKRKQLKRKLNHSKLLVTSTRTYVLWKGQHDGMGTQLFRGEFYRGAKNR